MEPAAFAPCRFADLLGWAEADLGPAMEAFARSGTAFLAGGVRAGAMGPPPAAFKPAAFAARNVRPGEARAFFEHHFQPARIMPANGGTGFVTGYYEPEVDASPVRTARHATPLYRRPTDLVSLTSEQARAAGLDPDLRFARLAPDGQRVAYHDRAAIAAGALAGRGLEIAWLEDPADAFFIHVQGSARLRLSDGRRLRVGYAAKSGHPFTPIGRVLVERGVLTLDGADMAGIRRWLAAHPGEAEALMNRNRSFIFFEERAVANEALGPTGAAGLALTALGSLAVDGALHTYGLPVFVDAPTLTLAPPLVQNPAPFRRLLVAQDTGSAIVGPARGDIFVGSGVAAGAAAGAIRHRADFTALLPREGRA